MRSILIFLNLFVIFLWVVPGIAEAYIGPGAGLSVIGTVVALIGAILLGIVGFIWYPIKRLLAKKNKKAMAECNITEDTA